MSASNGVYAEFLLTRQSGSEKVPASRGVGFMHYPGYCARCQWIGGIFALYGLLQTCDRSVARGDAPASAATAPLQSSTCGSARCSDCTPARDHASPIPSEITQADSGRITRSCLNIDLYSDCVQGYSSSGVRDATRTRSRGLAWAHVRRSARVCSWPSSVALGLFPLPRPVGVTNARYVEACQVGAGFTPKEHKGTRAASPWVPNGVPSSPASRSASSVLSYRPGYFSGILHLRD